MINTQEKLNIAIVGIGEFGSNMVRNLMLENGWIKRSISIDWRPTMLSESSAKKKIRIKKNADYFEEVYRIKETLKEELLDIDIVFLFADLYEEIICNYAPVIARAIKSFNIVTVGVVLLPHKREKKSINKKAHSILLDLRRYIAVASIRPGTVFFCDDDNYADQDIFDSIGNYMDLGYYSEVSMYNGRKLKQKSIDFSDNQNIISTYNAATSVVEKILKMLSIDYVNSNPNSVLNIMRTPGGLHIASAHNEVIEHKYPCEWPPKRAYVLERKLTISGLLNTSIDSTRSMLLHLIVPTDIQKEEIKYLCEQIEGRSGAEHIEFALDVDVTLGSTIKAEIIATDALAEYECEEYSQMYY